MTVLQQRPVVRTPLPTQPVSTGVRIGSLLAGLYIGGFYVATCGSRYKQVAYVGAMYAVAALGILIFASMAAAGTRFGRLEWPAWFLAALTAVGTFIGFFVAHTVGLPSYHPSGWPPGQLIAMAADLVYLALFAIALRQWRAGR